MIKKKRLSNDVEYEEDEEELDPDYPYPEILYGSRHSIFQHRTHSSFNRVNNIIQHGKKILQQEASGYVFDLSIKAYDDSSKFSVAALSDVLKIWHILNLTSNADLQQQHCIAQ
ncbi:hypothetical protein MRB53_039857 [Persea americana]|nr:hypothetical protein MRB53_039857 [Persea americana]